MGFKKHAARDIKNIYTNINEHADLTRVRYNSSEEALIPVVFDLDGNVERQRQSSPVGRDHGTDVFVSDLVVYIAEKHLNTRPRKETNIEIDDDVYSIVRVGRESGMYRLWLEMLDD